MDKLLEQIRRQKALLRQEALRRRAEQPDKDRLSLQICQTLLAMPEFQAARTILFYVHYGDEVRTQPLLRYLLGEAETFAGGPAESLSTAAREPFSPQEAIARGPNRQARQLLVPYCQGNDLKLFRLRSMAELEPGRFGILEPRSELRQSTERQATIQEVDLVVVPGVAFDRRGGRLGHGRGYYDRLLAQARPDTLLVGLAYECQILPETPILPGDIPVDKLITEANVYIRN